MNRRDLGLLADIESETEGLTVGKDVPISLLPKRQ
jgi:hypothetical protein